MTVYCENHAKHRNTLRGGRGKRYVELVLSGAYINTVLWTVDTAVCVLADMENYKT